MPSVIDHSEAKILFGYYTDDQDGVDFKIVATYSNASQNLPWHVFLAAAENMRIVIQGVSTERINAVLEG